MPKSTLPGWLKRVIVEANELGEKRAALESYMQSDLYLQTVGQTQRSLLRIQSAIMESYSEVLAERIIEGSANV